MTSGGRVSCAPCRSACLGNSRLRLTSLVKSHHSMTRRSETPADDIKQSDADDHSNVTIETNVTDATSCGVAMVTGFGEELRTNTLRLSQVSHARCLWFGWCSCRHSVQSAMTTSRTYVVAAGREDGRGNFRRASPSARLTDV